MIIWSGWGIVVPIIAMAVLGTVELGVETLMNDPKYYQSHGWPILLASILTAVFLWSLGRKMNESPGGGHTFFFIPVEYWSPLALLAGIVAMFKI